jgi:heterodisulfide reductase subunit C
MQYAPRQLIAMARAGMRDEVLSSNSMWYCASCYLCTVRCPRDIKPTDLMHVLECLATRHGLSTKKNKTPAMYQTFSNLVYGTGGMPEMGLMMRYYLKTNPFKAMGMIPTAFTMIRHGRISLKSRKLKPEAQRQFKAILDKAKELGGA